MKAKTFEIRDVATFIPVLAVQLDPEVSQDEFLFARAGYGLNAVQQSEYVLLCRIDGGSGECSTDAFNWTPTLRNAHLYIIDHWNDLQSGQVIDLEFLRGDSTAPKVSERFDMENPL